MLIYIFQYCIDLFFMNKVIKVKNLIKILIVLTFGLFSTSGFSLSSDWSISEKSKVRLISPVTVSNNNNQLIFSETSCANSDSLI